MTEENVTELIQVAVTKTEKEAIEELAKKDFRSVSKLCRIKL